LNIRLPPSGPRSPGPIASPNGWPLPISWSCVSCEDVDEIDDAFERPAEGGSVLMPLDNYGWSTRFGWVKNRFGVAWRLDVSADAD
jgi:uncharacterized glyoxalase superfamily protein PhnB